MSSSAFYNSIAWHYDEYCNTSHINSTIHEEVTLLENYKPSSILEFGIGTGRLARKYIINNRDVHYVGVDNSQEMLKYAQDTGAILVYANFENYVQEVITNNITFDCIIAPYTVFHHIKTDKQISLIEKMKQVSSLIIINCLTQEEERKLFGTETTTDVTFLLPNNPAEVISVYRMHPEVRVHSKKMSCNHEREYLIFDTRNLLYQN